MAERQRMTTEEVVRWLLESDGTDPVLRLWSYVSSEAGGVRPSPPSGLAEIRSQSAPRTRPAGCEDRTVIGR